MPRDDAGRARAGDVPMDPSEGARMIIAHLDAMDCEPSAAPEPVDLDALERELDGDTRVRVDDPDSWRDLLLKKSTKTGDVVLPNLSNVVTILRYHPSWRGVLAWNAFGERVAIRRPAPWHPAVAPTTVECGVFRETDIARVVDWLARNESLAVAAKLVEQAIPVVAETCAFHPVREYLEALEWDGVERLPTWLSTYCGARQSEYSGAIGTRWMVSAVARPMEPGCQVDCMLILEGPQGIRKSTLFRNLVPDPALYSETGVTIGDKDSYQGLHGIWIYLLDELDSLKRGDVTRVKNFMTSQKDHLRPSYGRVARDYFRQNVFAGTTNEDTYLVDRTGNRRFWPERVLRFIDIEAVIRDRDQLWAEAFARYVNGERWYADTPALRRLCEAQQAEREQGDPWEEIVARWLADPRHHTDGDLGGASGSPLTLLASGVTIAEVLAHAIGKPKERITRADEMRVGEVLRALGYERGPRRREDGDRVRRYRKVGTVGTEGVDTSKTEEKAAESQVSIPSIPNTCAHTRDSGVLITNTQPEDPGVDGRDSGQSDFADYLEREGIGGGQ